MLKPIEIKHKLASQVRPTPKLKVTVKNKAGQPVDVVDPRATRALIALMDMQAVLGGAASHWGGPAAFAELMAATFGLAFHEANQKKQTWYENIQILNDAGHCENGLYALKANYGFADLSFDSLKDFRSIKSPLAGHGEAHLFPEGVYLSNGPLGSCLPQAQGLCLADRLANRSRVTVTAISDGACMEGEARESLASIPGLATKNKMNPFVLIISDNNTKLSGRVDDQSFSMQPTFAALVDLGWKVLKLDQPHDLQKTYLAVEEAIELARKNPQQPVAIHAKTIKGFGVKKTMEGATGGHGFPLSNPKDLRAFVSEIYANETIPSEFTAWLEDFEKEKPAAAKSAKKYSFSDQPSEKVQVGVAAAFIEKKNQGYPIVSISADLPGSTGVAEFQKKFPESTQDVGVAESNMVSIAAGFSKEGFIPVVDTFSQFGVTKGALPLIMANLSHAPVFCVYSHAGLQDAADGASHQALSYFSMTCSIPETDVYSLTSSDEAKSLVSQALDQFYNERKQNKTPKSIVFFLGRENFARRFVPEGQNYQLGKAQVVLDKTSGAKKSVTIVAAGALLPQALIAAEELYAQGIGCIVINPSIINRPDVATISQALQKTQGQLITVEDHQVTGGMGSILVHALAQADVAFKVKSLGVQNQFGRSAYNAIDLYKLHGIDSQAIIKAAQT